MTPVALVITSYNRDRYLTTAIQSVLAQTHPNFELLVWDDGSTDHSVAVAQAYAQQDARIRVVAAPHQGLSRSLSQAIASTTHHPYLGWVDSDDLLAPTALTETAAILDAQPQTGMVYTDYRIIDAEGDLRGKGHHGQIPYSPQRLLVEFMTFHFRLLRRSCYEQVGGVDPTFERAEDYDLCLRLSEVTDIVHLPRPLYFYRQHGGNVTHDDLEMLRWTHRASTQALQRRGLANRYEIRVRSELTLQLKPESLPLVTIIIPCYNAEKTLDTCLKSCFEQSYPNIEVLVIDNNSTDSTAALLQHHKELAPCPFRLLHCPEQGANHARNLGLLQAKGDYIQWLDADDQLAPNKLERQVMALEREAAYAVAYGDWQWCCYQQQRLAYRLTFKGQAYDDWLLQLLMDNWRPPHAYLLRRSAAGRLHELSAWNTTTPVGMDREYFTLAALAGFQALYVPGARAIYNSGLSTQITQSTPYAVRVRSLRAMFQRFQVQAQGYGHLEQAHRFLLNQSWGLWQPSFEHIGQTEQVCWLRHQKTGEQMMLRDSEGRIVQTWLKLPGAFILEDQARRIVLQLWRETVVNIRRSRGLEAALDPEVVSLELAVAVGLVAQTDDINPTVEQSQVELEPEFVALLQNCPVYTPMFAEQRLTVHRVLEQLRLKGWLDEHPVADSALLG